MKVTHTHSQNGQSLIIIALMIVGIFGFLGLVLDGGQVFLTRRNSQDAADAGAFAAVSALATRPDNSITSELAIYSAARDYARVNHVVTDTDVTVAYIDQTGTPIRTINPASPGPVPNPLVGQPLATGVLVTATIRLQPYFIDVLIGNNPIPIQSVAAAQSGPPSVASLLTPMTIYCPNQTDPACNFQYAPTVYRLFGGTISKGGFQWIDYKQINPFTGTGCSIEDYFWLTCNSGPVLADRSDKYYSAATPTLWNTPPPSPNPWIASNTGAQLAQIADPLDCWLNPTGTYNNGKLQCWQQPRQGPMPKNRLWTVPVFNHDNGITGNNAKFHVSMFAEFEFRGYWFSNNQCNWVGMPSTKNNLCDDKDPLIRLSSDLLPCLQGQMFCLMGTFNRDVTNVQLVPAACNTTGLDVCGFGLSQ